MSFSVSVNVSQRLLSFELMSQAHRSHLQSLWPSLGLSLSFSSKSNVNSPSKSFPGPCCLVFTIIVAKLGNFHRLISSVPAWLKPCFIAVIKVIDQTLSGDDRFLWFSVLLLRVLIFKPFIYKNEILFPSFKIHAQQIWKSNGGPIIIIILLR